MDSLVSDLSPAAPPKPIVSAKVSLTPVSTKKLTQPFAGFRREVALGDGEDDRSAFVVRVRPQE